MKKNIAVVGFGFMGMTHTLNILKNPNLNLTAIVDKNMENIVKNLVEQSGNFSTGTISAEQLSPAKMYSDFADCLHTEKPDHITALCLPGKLSNHNYVIALWKYNHSNLVVKVEGGNTFHAAYPFQAAFTARFENASVSLSGKDPGHIIVTTETETTLVPAGDSMEGFSGEMDYFAECLINNQPPVKCTPDSALESIKICYQHINKK